jgi:hypothetical protein
MSQSVESITGNQFSRSPARIVASCVFYAIIALTLFYFSMLTSSKPVTPAAKAAIDRAVAVLESKGFDQEVFLLRHTAVFRSTDNWLNRMNFNENAYAATNFPFQVITLYPDFYNKASDDTERAMILLHEAQHLKGSDEADAYAYVWENRERLGWTQLSHGTTPTYTTIEQQTREYVPELFTCSTNLWNDCTEILRVKR